MAITINNERLTDVLIIGNGFDLNLGLKTSYSDFINSVEFAKIQSGNSLCKHLYNQQQLKQWIDIEKELKRYSGGGQAYYFEEDYKRLCEALINYLGELNYESLNRASNAYRLLQSLINSNFLVIDFNYTSTVSQLLQLFHLENLEISKRIIKMHGSVDTKQIIFGVEDAAEINQEHIFLKKSYSKQFNPLDLKRVLSDVDNIYFFGHSLGETDHTYFKGFISECLYGGVTGKKLQFYYYGEKGYKDLHIQLDVLTQRQLATFKQRNRFIAHDCSLADNPVLLYQ